MRSYRILKCIKTYYYPLYKPQVALFEYLEAYFFTIVEEYYSLIQSAISLTGTILIILSPSL